MTDFSVAELDLRVIAASELSFHRVVMIEMYVLVQVVRVGVKGETF